MQSPEEAAEHPFWNTIVIDDIRKQLLDTIDDLASTPENLSRIEADIDVSKNDTSDVEVVQ